MIPSSERASNGGSDRPNDMDPDHLADLYRSGLTDATIQAAGLYTECDPAVIGKLLAWKGPAYALGRCLAFPYRDAAGNINGYCRVKPSRPRTKDSKAVKYESPKGKSNRAYFPPGTIAALTDSIVPLLVTEGEKKALAADQHGLPCIGLTGVYGWQKKREKDAKGKPVGPRELIDDLEAVAWNDRSVYIVYDSDAARTDKVRRAEAIFAGLLIEHGSKVFVVRLPEGPLGDDGTPAKVGLDDYLLTHSAEELQALMATAEEVEAGATKTASGRPVVVIGTDEHRVIAEVIDALARLDGGLYQRSGKLVYLSRDSSAEGEKPSPRIAPLPLAQLRTRIARFVELVEIVPGRGDAQPTQVLVHPPKWLVEGVAAAGCWPGVRHLEAVVDVPTLRPDGSVHQTPGYDPATGVVYSPSAEFPDVPAAPTRADAVAAVNALLEVLADFPLAEPAHRAGWLAGLLTPLARFSFRGPTPIFLVTSNVRASGKGLLTNVAGNILTGRDFAFRGYPSGRDRADEMRKAITAMVIVGERYAVLDNIDNGLGDASLDIALTATEWTDRTLGFNNIISGQLNMVWWATGNNVSVIGDTNRRVQPIRIESPEERPEERQNFRHPDLLAWVRQERGRLLTAALTILSAYLRAGSPKQNLIPWGSYAGWSSVVRAALVWAGQPDPRAACREFAESGDTEAAALATLLDAWSEVDPDGYGITVADLLRKITPTPGGAQAFPRMADAIAEFCPTKGGSKPTPSHLGKRLSHFARRNVGNRMLDSRPGRANAKVWFVGQATAPRSGEVGEAGEVAAANACAGAGAQVEVSRRLLTNPTTLTAGREAFEI